MKIAPLLAVLILTISGFTQGPTWQPFVKGSRIGHGTMVYSAVFSPDSKYLASYDQSGTIVIWELASQKVIVQIDDTEIESFKEPVFSPDGKILAAVVARHDDPRVLLDETIRFWEVQTGKPIASPEGGFRGIEHLTFSPDSKTLIAAIDLKETAVWDLGTLKRKPLPLKLVGPYSFISTGTQLAAVTPENKTVVIIDPTSGRKIRTIPGYGFVASLEFAPGGKYLAVNDEIEGVGMRLKTFNLSTGRMISGFDAVDSHPPVAFTSDGRSAILIQFEKEFAEELGETTRIGALFDPATGKKQKDLIVNAPINGFGTTFSRDGRFLAVRSGSSSTNIPDSELRVIDLTAGTVTASLKGYRRAVTSLAFIGDGSELVTGHPDGKLIAWNPSTWTPARWLAIELDYDVDPKFLPGSKYFTIASSADVFELSTGKQIGESQTSYDAVSGDGSLMLDANDEQFSFFDVPSKTIRYSFPTAFQWLGLSIALDRTGEKFAIGQEGYVDVIESRSGKLISRFPILPKGTISGLAYSPDGKYLGFMNSEPDSRTSRWTLNVLDAGTGKVVFKAPKHDGYFAFSNDGSNVVSLGDSDKIILTRLADGRTLMESKVRVIQLGDSIHFAFHPTRPLVAVGTEYGVQVFDTTTGAQVARLR